MGWIIFVVLITLGVLGLLIYNIRSLVRKWKFNKGSWFDLLIGIIIWTVGAGAVIWIVIKYVLENIDYV